MPLTPDPLAEALTQMDAQRHERYAALTAYLDALPCTTRNHWELFRLLVDDLAALREASRR